MVAEVTIAITPFVPSFNFWPTVTPKFPDNTFSIFHAKTVALFSQTDSLGLMLQFIAL